MAQVNVTVGGRSYRMGCEPGEEERLEQLAGVLHETIEGLRADVGEIGDQRLAVMAGVLLADREDGLKRRIEALESKVGETASDSKRVRDLEKREAALTRAIDGVAERLEGLAQRLALPSEPAAPADAEGEDAQAH